MRALTGALVFLLLVLAGPRVGAAQQGSDDLQRRKTDLEIQKLELEIAKLKVQDLPAWLIGLLGLAVGVGGTVSSLVVSRRARVGALDQSVHDKRLESYPQVVKAAAPLAAHFPAYDPYDPSARALEPKACGAMGQAMSGWYFDGGGLLLSTASRDAYFRLARALTRASLAKELNAPTFPVDAEKISNEQLKHYREKLSGLEKVDLWVFGGSASDEEPAFRFKDYVFLQHLSSAFRTALSEDLRSRRRPSE